MENCIYRFLDKLGKVIYIGKAKNLKQRMSNHCHLPSRCYEETVIIEYCTFCSEYDMDLAERYFIPKYNPKYNTVLYGKEITLSILEFDEKEWFTFSKEECITTQERKEHQQKKQDINIDDVIKEKIELAKNEHLKKLEKPVVVVCTGETFRNVHEASAKFGIETRLIVDSCDGVFCSIWDKHPIYNCSLSFVYQEKYNYENMAAYIERYTRGVVCLTTGEEFVNLEMAQEKYNIVNVKGCCNGLANYCGTTDNAPLVWMWKDKCESCSEEYIDKKMKTAYEIYLKKTKEKVA